MDVGDRIPPDRESRLPSRRLAMSNTSVQCASPIARAGMDGLRSGSARPSRNAIRGGLRRHPVDLARPLVVTFFEWQLEKLQPIPQTSDADLDLTLSQKPSLQLGKGEG